MSFDININDFSTRILKENINDFIDLYISQNSAITTGYAFGVWYFKILKGFDTNLILETLTDSRGDRNIDAIYLDHQGLIHFYQFKNPKDITKGINISKEIS